MRVTSIFAVLLWLSQACSAGVADPETFFSDPYMVGAKLGPDGSAVVAIVRDDGQDQVILISPASNKRRTVFSVSDLGFRSATIQDVHWVDRKHIAVQVTEVAKGVRDLLDTRRRPRVVIVRFSDTDDQQPLVIPIRTGGALVDHLPAEDNAFLYGTWGVHSKIYKLRAAELTGSSDKRLKLAKVDGGQFVEANVVGSAEGFAVRWFTDNAGKPVAVLTAKGDKLTLRTLAESGGTDLKAWSREELAGASRELAPSPILLPVALAAGRNTFYCVDLTEEDERSVYRVNFETGQRELVYEEPSYKILDLVISNLDSSLIGVKVIRDGGVSTVYTGASETEAVQSAELEVLLDQTLNGNVGLYYRETHRQPGQYILRNKLSGEEHHIGSVFPHLDNNLSTRLEENKLVVEGLEIPFLLTLPRESFETKKYSLVVLIHGGPFGVFDHRYFDLITQFIAATGYAVLRVNFRGSGGYSSQLREAGKRQWGAKMLTDIHSVVQAVAPRNDIDAGKVCAMGMSYGGYAAMMLAIRYPEKYTCAVNIAGVSDVNLLLNQPNLSASQEAWLTEYVGDTTSEYEALQRISPVYLIEQLQRPLLIIHGAQDQTVDVEHAYRLKHMLDKHGKSYRWRLLPEGRHDIRSSGEIVTMFGEVQQFLQEYL